MKIRVIDASKKIRGHIVLEQINLNLESGKIYGLQGPNGSGKTMLMRLIAGLIHPNTGAVYIGESRLGKDVDFPDSLGLMIENPAFLTNHTGFKNLELLANINSNVSMENIRQTLIDVGLDPDDKRTVRKYSLGMKQRLGIAAAIMEQPDIIILDEPINALDEDGVRKICNVIRNERDRGALIIMSCHDASILDEMSDEIFMVYNGKITPKAKSEL